MSAKRKVKDTVFTKVFSEPEYAFKLYKVFHPEDTTSTENDLEIITLENVLVDGEHNDLGLLLNNRLMLFIEAQSTWNDNMPIRILLYLAETYKRYLMENKIDLFHDTNVAIPVPEAYVIFTGDRTDKPDEMKLSDYFPKTDLKFTSGKNSLELKVKMIYNSDEGDVVQQYIAFCKVFDEQRKLYLGDGDKAIKETIRICKDRNLLADFFQWHEAEVYEIMSESLSEFFLNLHIECEKDKARKEGVHNARIETARNLLKKGIPLETVLECTGLSLDEITTLQTECAGTD